MTEKKVSGTISRRAKSGLQLDNVNQWYNKGFGYKGDDFDSLAVGQTITFDANEKGFITNLEVKNTNGHTASAPIKSSEPRASVPGFTANPAVQRSVVAYAVIQPAVAHLTTMKKTQKEVLTFLSELSKVVESYVIGGTETLSDLLSKWNDSNGSTKKS